MILNHNHGRKKKAFSRPPPPPPRSGLTVMIELICCKAAAVLSKMRHRDDDYTTSQVYLVLLNSVERKSEEPDFQDFLALLETLNIEMKPAANTFGIGQWAIERRTSTTTAAFSDAESESGGTSRYYTKTSSK